MVTHTEAQHGPAGGGWAGLARYGRRHATQLATIAVGLVIWLIFVYLFFRTGRQVFRATG